MGSLPSIKERDRRWAALQEMMRREEFDVLIVAGHDYRGHKGALHYVTGLALFYRYGFAIMLPDTEPVLILPNNFSAAHLPDFVEDRRFSQSPAREVATLIGGSRQEGRIGMVGMGGIIKLADFETIRKGLPSASIVDATAAFEAIRRLKSPEELSYLQETADLADDCFQILLDDAAPGVSELELSFKVEQTFRRAGCADSLLLVMGVIDKDGRGVPRMSPPLDRPIGNGELFTFSLEFTGPHGYWVEFARPIAIGGKRFHDNELTTAYMNMIPAMQAALQPDATGASIYQEIAGCFAGPGVEVTGSIGHGIGLDVIEAPLVAAGHTDPLGKDVALALHPRVLSSTQGSMVYAADIYLPADGKLAPASRWAMGVY